jgi:hypothetical protein
MSSKRKGGRREYGAEDFRTPRHELLVPEPQQRVQPRSRSRAGGRAPYRRGDEDRPPVPEQNRDPDRVASWARIGRSTASLRTRQGSDNPVYQTLPAPVVTRALGSYTGCAAARRARLGLCSVLVPTRRGCRCAPRAAAISYGSVLRAMSPMAADQRREVALQPVPRRRWAHCTPS